MGGKVKYVVVRESFRESVLSDFVTVLSMIGGAYVGVIMGSIALQVLFPILAVVSILGASQKKSRMNSDEAIEYINKTKGKSNE